MKNRLPLCSPATYQSFHFPPTMAGTSDFLQPTQEQNQALNSIFTGLDPKSLILSQFSNSDQPHTFQLTTDSFFFERGPRYKAYADLRESRLRAKSMKLSITEQNEKKHIEASGLTPKREVKFQRSFTTPPKRLKGSSILTQSVPDFSSALRKENRKPAKPLPPVMEKSVTPPAGLKSGRFHGVVGKLGGSKSANSGEKRGGGMMARKSYASIEELKGLASAARNAINGDNRGGRTTRGVGKTVLGYRQF